MTSTPIRRPALAAADLRQPVLPTCWPLGDAGPPTRRTVLLPEALGARPPVLSAGGVVTAVVVAGVTAATSATAVWLGAATAGATCLLGVALSAAVEHRGRRPGRLRDDLDAAEAAVEAHRRSVEADHRRFFPTSTVVAERLRSGLGDDVLGAPVVQGGGAAWVVLGRGPVESGIEVVGGDDVDAATALLVGPPPEPDDETERRRRALVLRAATLDDGPLCVDGRGGVHVVGPAVLVRGVAAGLRLQLLARGAPVQLVSTGPPEAPAASPAVACVLALRPDGTAWVTRRDGRECRVPVTVSSISVHDERLGAGPCASRA
jgi:hypothetical protein